MYMDQIHILILAEMGGIGIVAGKSYSYSKGWDRNYGGYGSYSDSYYGYGEYGGGRRGDRRGKNRKNRWLWMIWWICCCCWLWNSAGFKVRLNEWTSCRF